ncbi:MAG: carbon-nitrogen hydrolase family protein [Cypionkella sp.]|nr:carbon-nitrogen hydrolase family protein [Cypionkella sp.]
MGRAEQAMTALRDKAAGRGMCPVKQGGLMLVNSHQGAGLVRIGVTQTPEYRNDTSGAIAHLVEVSARAAATGVSLLVFPEGYLQGYLLGEQEIRAAALSLSSPAFEDVLAQFPSSGPVMVVGLIEEEAGSFFNTAIIVKARRLIGRYRKKHLLSAERGYTSGNDCPIFEVDGLRFGISICYDTNFPDTARSIADAGASLIVCCANNMLPRAKAEIYRDVHNEERANRCRETGLWLASSDVTGERGDMVSWGPGAIITPAGEVVAQLALGEAGLLIFDVPAAPTPSDVPRSLF